MLKVIEAGDRERFEDMINKAEGIIDWSTFRTSTRGSQTVYIVITEITEPIIPEEAGMKAQCPKCGGTNVHYKKGCLDCLKESEKKEAPETTETLETPETEEKQPVMVEA